MSTDITFVTRWVEVRASGGCVRDQWVSRGEVLLVRFPETGPLMEIAGLVGTTEVLPGELCAVRGEAGVPGSPFEVELTWLCGDWLAVRSVEGPGGHHDVSAGLLRRMQTRIDAAAAVSVSEADEGRLPADAVVRAVGLLEETASLLGQRMVDYSWSSLAWKLVDGSATGHAQLVAALLAPNTGHDGRVRISTSHLRRLFIAYQLAPGLAGSVSHEREEWLEPLSGDGPPSPDLVAEVMTELETRLTAAGSAYPDVDWGSTVLSLAQATPVVVAAVLEVLQQRAYGGGNRPDIDDAPAWDLVYACTVDLLDDLGVAHQVRAALHSAQRRDRQIVLR